MVRGMKAGIGLVLWLAAVGLVSGAAVAPADLEEVFRESERVLAGVDSYTAVFHKQEQVNGKLLAAERVAFKFKKPFQVYMKWVAQPHKGRETLYVEGANENRIKAHEGGLLSVVTVNLDPKGAKAMKGNRHPITDSGLGKLVDTLATNVRLGRARGELEVRVLGEETVYGRKTVRWEGVFPKAKSEVYYCHRAVVDLDAELKVPIRVQIFDAADQLIELYGYEKLQLNAGLTEADFDATNPAYGF